MLNHLHLATIIKDVVANPLGEDSTIMEMLANSDNVIAISLCSTLVTFKDYYLDDSDDDFGDFNNVEIMFDGLMDNDGYFNFKDNKSGCHVICKVYSDSKLILVKYINVVGGLSFSLIDLE